MTRTPLRRRSFRLILRSMAMILAGGILAGCAGCANPDAPEPVPIPRDSGASEVVPTPTPEPAQGSRVDADGVWLDESGQPLARIVYFDLDEAVLKPRDLRILDRHAEFLRENRNRSLLIEGHCDERGTREYNLALGERRANAVQGYLVSAGVNDAQLDTVSYGEERPQDVGHDEAAWAKNRRAALSYR